MGVEEGTKAPGASGLRFRSPACIALVSIFMRYFLGLFPFPAGSLFSVFQNDPGVEQVLPDLIGPREVARFLGGIAFLNELIHPRVGQAAFDLGRLQDGKDSVESVEKIERR